MKFSILGELLLVLIHCVTGINFNERKFSVKEVSLYSEETWKAKFDTFIEKYGKKYDTDEEYNMRFNAYKVINIQFIYLPTQSFLHRQILSKQQKQTIGSHTRCLVKILTLTTQRKIGLLS